MNLKQHKDIKEQFRQFEGPQERQDLFKGTSTTKSVDLEDMKYINHGFNGSQGRKA